MKKKKPKVQEDTFDLVSVEESVLKYWEENYVFQKVKNEYLTAPKWVYYDGPITANGLPHYGHAITWTMKDVIPRYQTMLGKYVSRNMGWDCQGILVEYEVEKSLNFKHKDDIQKYGVDKFNQACKNSVLKFRGKMLEYETRLGRWIDNSDEYSTMDPKYIESMWWGIKTLYEKGLLYKGHKVVAYSTRAGMTLSSHEVADGGYEDVEDPAVTVKFKAVDAQNTYFLAWTTTPWTLPGNLLLAVNKKVMYVKVEKNGEKYILAEKCLGKVFPNGDYKVVEKIPAKKLVGQKYKPLFDYYSGKRSEGCFEVVYGDHVNTEEGTGIVHLAPYGEDDFNIFMARGIKLFDYLDETGNFTDKIQELKSMFYKDANPKIIQNLKKSNLLLKEEKYTHAMPVSYRTKEPLIYKPIESWYVDVQKIKPKMLSELKKVKWVPEKAGQRFKNWVENARDWSLSRMRYWGTPMPIWVNDKTGEIVVIGSFKELEVLSGQRLPTDFDPHKPFVDEITWEAKDGGTFKRVLEVIDVWFDSGSMPYAQYHFPFGDKKLFKSRFPAQYISESDDQIRLWFYTMYVLGVALFDKTPFLNVITTGMLGDQKGRKMSKSKGNYPPVEEVFKGYGSDMLRYFLLTSPITRGEFTSFSYDLLLETKKEFFTTFWNSYKYFSTYSRLHKTAKKEIKFEDLNEHLDKWIYVRLQKMAKNVNKFLEQYEVMYAARELAPFVNDLSTWYIRRSRDRLSQGDEASLNVLGHCLETVCKLAAPFIPLLSDYIYMNLWDRNLDSVHLQGFPVCDESVLGANKKLLSEVEQERKVASMANALRKENNLPIKQPLSLLVTSVKLSSDSLATVANEINVKKAEVKNSAPKGKDWISVKDNGLVVSLNTALSDDLLIEGYARELIREIQKLRKQANVEWDAKVKVQYPKVEKFEKAVKSHKKEIMQKTLASELLSGSEFKVL